MTINKLNHLAVIRFSGEDAKTFLQGQLTNDLEALESQWHYSGYCSPKGRLLALFAMWRDQQDFLALLPIDLVESTLKRLRMYVMRSKVVIEVIDQVSVYGVFEPNDIEQFDLDSVTNHREVRKFDDDIWVLNFGQRWLLIDQLHSLDKHLGNSEASTTQWLIRNVRDGLPAVTESTSELFIPQMLNLDLADGISFKKGCYTGQEIVARMHYLGKLKQRMVLCNCSNSTKLKPGEKIYSSTELDKSVGNIASVANNGTLLAVIRLDSLSEPLFLGDQQPLSVAAQQPYSFEAPEK